MTVGLSSNNLITKTIANQSKLAEQPVQQNTTQPHNTQLDTYTPSRANKKFSNKTAIITNLVSGVVLVGLFFAPELLFARRMKNANRVMNQAMNFKPLIGNTLTSQAQKYLSNGRVKTTLENIKGRFKYNEIVVIQNGKPFKRILIKKEEMPNGKFILREMKTYQGKNILDNNQLAKNEDKFLVKHYKRSAIDNNTYSTTVSSLNKKADKTKYYCTSYGEPILRIKETPTQKENSVFLYNKDTCVGIDKQIVPKDDTKEVYNILTIPQNNIFNQKYDYKNSGIPYDNKLRLKLKDNF